MIVITAVIIAVLVLSYFMRNRSNGRRSSNNLVIIVLGDIGRSPRMLYHAQSAISRQYRVKIVAYRGSNPPLSLTTSEYVEFVYLPTPLPWISALPKPLFLLLAPLKVISASCSLLFALLYRIGPSPAHILVQNPPAIPTLPIVQIAAHLRQSKIIIDWHNTGHSVLALRLGTSHPVVKIARWIEVTCGRHAFLHLCVTEAMYQHLTQEARVTGKVVVYHDRPPAHFARSSIAEKHELFVRLPIFTDPSLVSFFGPSAFPTTTPFTESAKTITLRSDRPALLISATSWTPDEDFSLLLEALATYDDAATAAAMSATGDKLPKIFMIITGKGAGRATFEAEVKEYEKAWKYVRVRTAWLAMEDYPKLLGSSDLGISLHTSTSGADLPMKVVDMFGCGLPVCALDFACLDELVQDGVNGRTFKTSSELSQHLITLLRPFPDTSQLDKLSLGIASAKYGEEQTPWCSWDENWSRVIAPQLLPESANDCKT